METTRAGETGACFPAPESVAEPVAQPHKKDLTTKSAPQARAHVLNLKRTTPKVLEDQIAIDERDGDLREPARPAPAFPQPIASPNTLRSPTKKDPTAKSAPQARAHALRTA